MNLKILEIVKKQINLKMKIHPRRSDTEKDSVRENQIAIIINNIDREILKTI